MHAGNLFVPKCATNEIFVINNSSNYSGIISLARSGDGEFFNDMTCEEVYEILLDRSLNDDDLIEITSKQIKSENSSDDVEDEQPITAGTIKDGLKT